MTVPTANPILEQFKKLGDKASFHFADDTCREWASGHRAEKAAMKLFNDNPGLQNEMRMIARAFLWSIS